jgi:hypothetical protein
MREDPLEFHKKSPDEKFWKMDHAIGDMLLHLKSRSELLCQIREETVIPDQARDIAIKAISDEIRANKLFFFDYLLNFIGISMQGLHKVDVEFLFTLYEGGIIEMDKIYLIVDGEARVIPVEIGYRYITKILKNVSQHQPEYILQFYLSEETRYDTLFGGVMDRCTLEMMEEIYPKKCHHIKLKLPSQTIFEHNLTL